MLQFVPIALILLLTARLSYWDVREHRLPNRITLTIFPVAVICVALSFRVEKIGVALGVALLVFVIGVLISSTGTLGMGDVKLLTGMAVALSYFSPTYFLLSLISGLLFATFIAGLMIVRKRIEFGSKIALGPYLLAGFALATVPLLAEELFTGVA